MSGACAECDLLARPDAPVRRRGRFAIHGRLETPPVPGWIVVASVRHVEQVDDLDDTEQAELGPLLARVAAALRAATPTAKVYVNVYAEVLAHLHVHLIARPPDLPAERRGARLFLEAGPEDMAPSQRVTRAVLEALR